MDDSPNTEILAAASAPESQDEFASGSPNLLRRLGVRFAAWLFRAPYFPAELTWFLLAIIASGTAIELLSQAKGYWINPSISPYHTFLGTPLDLGLWTFGIYLVYMLAVSLALSLLHSKPALALWIGLAVFHFWDLTELFRCGTVRYLPFENASNCAEYHSASILLAGVLWGIGIVTAIDLELVPWVKARQTGPHPARKWTRVLQSASMVWIVAMGLSIAAGATTPKPAWSRVISDHSPAARSSASLSYDTHRSVAVLFGGTTSWAQNTGWGSVNDTWEWDGSDWTELHPAQSPLPRFGAGMTYDPNRGVTVLFGGAGQDSDSQTVFYSDTWEWDGEDWKQITLATMPPARQGHVMFFDPVRETPVIYGGYYFDANTQSDVFLNDAWAWDGNAWAQLAFEQPRRNSASAIIYDPIQNLPMLMDAEGLWVWEELRWYQPNFNSGPPGRWSSQLVYDPAKAEIILFGGYEGDDIYDDTWVYDGQTWQQVMTTAGPPRRSGHNLFYDQTRNKVIVFGGLDGLTFYNDMWELVKP